MYLKLSTVLAIAFLSSTEANAAYDFEVLSTHNNLDLTRANDGSCQLRNNSNALRLIKKSAINIDLNKKNRLLIYGYSEGRSLPADIAYPARLSIYTFCFGCSRSKKWPSVSFNTIGYRPRGRKQDEFQVEFDGKDTDAILEAMKNRSHMSISISGPNKKNGGVFISSIFGAATGVPELINCVYGY